MATRQPNVQTRGQFGSYWGSYALLTDCPNGATYPLTPLDTALATPLEAGDTAYVPGTGLVQCTSAGTPGALDAVWAAIGGGGGGQDRFAPTHLVGNTAAGDSAVAYSVAGFNYYPDTGNCVQLAAALAAAAGDESTVFVRRGLYSLNAVGAPVGPLPVPSNVTVRGEGVATILRCRATGNQGILSMAATSRLFEVLIEGDASDAGSLGSDALVLANDDVTIENVSFTLTTIAGGQLREALRCTATAPTPVPRLSNITINILTVTGVLDPTIGIEAIGTVIQADNLQVYGGDIAVDLDAARIDATNMLAVGFEVSAIRTSGESVVRVTQGLFIVGAGATSCVAVDLSGTTGAHSLRSVSIEHAGLQQIAGVRTSSIAFTSRVVIDTCRITGFADGVLFGDTVGGGAVNTSEVINSVIEAGGHGIRVAEGSEHNVFANNRITVSMGGSATVAAGIRIEGGASSANRIHDNSIAVTDPGTAAYGIQNAGRQTTIHDNKVSLGGGVSALYSEGERNTISGNVLDGNVCLTIADGASYNTVQGNVCFTSEAPYVGPILVYGGEYGTVNGNVTVVTSGAPAASAGIQLTLASSNSSCIGNVCRGSSVALIIDDLGIANNVASNIGAV